MKAYRLVRHSQVLTVLSPADAERMLATGDYVLASPKPKSKTAKSMRSLRARRRAEGWLQLDLWLPPDTVAAVKAAKLPGETYEALLVRLVNALGEP